MPYAIDETSGTQNVPFRARFPEGMRQAVVTIHFVNTTEPISEGYQNAVQSNARGTLQAAGFEVADLRTVYTLQADETLESYVQCEVHVGKDYPDEPPDSNDGE